MDIYMLTPARDIAEEQIAGSSTDELLDRLTVIEELGLRWYWLHRCPLYPPAQLRERHGIRAELALRESLAAITRRAA